MGKKFTEDQELIFKKHLTQRLVLIYFIYNIKPLGKIVSPSEH